MKLSLVLHPESRSGAVTAIRVSAARTESAALDLDFAVTGHIAALALPAPAAPARADELWRRTCFEVFVRGPSAECYFEFNLSPSTRWAAYRFDSYRAGMAPAGVVTDPAIKVTRSGGALNLRATLNLGAVAELAGATPWRVGLSAVIEAADGTVAYWALAHPRGKPDFHHDDCFAAELFPA